MLLLLFFYVTFFSKSLYKQYHFSNFKGMQTAAGSDWFTLSSKFVHYLVNKNETNLNTMKSFYKYSVHPLEVSATTFKLKHFLISFKYLI